MRTLRFAMVAALLLAAIPAVMAGNRDFISTPQSPASLAVGGLYDRTQLNKPSQDSPPVPLPMPTEPDTLHFQAAKGVGIDSGAVPLSSAKAEFGAALGGSALVAPRGGAMSTPRQVADREIARLIRRLN